MDRVVFKADDQDCMSYGERANTRIIHLTHWSTLSLGSWLWYRPGHESTEFSGKLHSSLPAMNQADAQ